MLENKITSNSNQNKLKRQEKTARCYTPKTTQQKFYTTVLILRCYRNGRMVEPSKSDWRESKQQEHTDADRILRHRRRDAQNICLLLVAYILIYIRIHRNAIVCVCTNIKNYLFIACLVGRSKK